jgi:hypothetical protein
MLDEEDKAVQFLVRHSFSSLLFEEFPQEFAVEEVLKVVLHLLKVNNQQHLANEEKVEQSQIVCHHEHPTGCLGHGCQELLVAARDPNATNGKVWKVCQQDIEKNHSYEHVQSLWQGHTLCSCRQVLHQSSISLEV